MNIDVKLLYSEESSRMHLEKLGNARKNPDLGAWCLKEESSLTPIWPWEGSAKNETQGLVAMTQGSSFCADCLKPPQPERSVGRPGSEWPLHA